MAKQRRVLGTPFKSPDNATKSVLEATSPTPPAANGALEHRLKEPDQQLPPEPQNGPEITPIKSPQPEPPAIELQTDSSQIESTDEPNIVCPICNEPMINAYQLNQHIDDVHMKDESQSSTTSPTPRGALSPSFLSPNNSLKNIGNDLMKGDIKKWLNGKDLTPLKRKTLNLDLFDGSKSFSLSDGNIPSEPGSPSKNSKSPTPLNRPRVSRSHWVQPTSNSTCSLTGCHKTLNVKNGIVNCRKCGKLFCNDHSDYKVKLRNPRNNEKIPQYDPKGILSKCCETCYFERPDLVLGTQVNINDLSSDFKALRLKKLEENQLIRDKLIRKFIKLVDVIGEFYLHPEQYQKKSLLNYANTIDYELLAEKQKAIVGYENWENDQYIQNCSVCLVKFNFIIRKHHCRICGKIVCDDKFGERQDCSLSVPINIFMEKLDYLNFSLQVKDNFDTLVKAKDEMFVVRVCKDCKNNLLYDFKMRAMNNLHSSSQPAQAVLNEIFSHYHQLLIIKLNINHHLPKYEASLFTPDFKIDTTNKLKERIMTYLKEFETLIVQFKNRYYNTNEIKPEYRHFQKLLNGINQSLIFFLQDNLIRFKDLNNKFKDKEEQLLPKKKEAVEPPRLTKKQIREFREQLMVMNEQKFILENLVNDVTKQRKFDEIQPLLNNKQEITNEIERLEQELGEFGF